MAPAHNPTPTEPTVLPYRGVVDVVIPARQETRTLPSCLAALTPQLSEYDSRVIIVCNGEEASELARQTEDFVRAARSSGIEVLVRISEVAGKSQALNLGDKDTRGGMVMYLDADIVLSPGAVSATMQRLHASAAPRLCSPRPEVASARSWLTRQYARIWVTLPAVAGDVVGAGCYAANAAGRRRWGVFPDQLPDDAYVRTRFAPDERVVASEATFGITLPEGADLVTVVRRWASGNARLATPSATAQHGPVRVGAAPCRNVRHILARPALWPSVPGFAVVWGLSRLRRAPFDPAWRPVRIPAKP